MILTQLARIFRQQHPFRITLAGSLLLICLGCTAQESTESTKTEPQPETTATEPETTAPEVKPEQTVEITLTLSDAAGFEEILKQQQGKVVLVDFWATWCVPCVKNFHHTVEWNKEFAGQGLSVISVSMDESDEETQKAVLKFLEEQDAQFTNILATAADDKDPMETYGIDGGALPHYRIYDRSGKLFKKFSFADPSQQFTQEDIKAALETALKQKPE
ncbi:TlpA family protein disulfide reductase [Gimesia panareensis]|uniref:Thiol-disulfide oxidoreductase ResA n=1 Tax=Gimesia panareensis TaxID=2527978 RepID=A0A517Q928_9PLAN|nr:TlpA disulfide reductase family protein [Gimesia panareensis]QDT28138.1 Thiol-disulfide oxidoreductase ResA [Gimesia panareensis]QDU51005.1 Thiol-disulfide oxidoreductase ResA [Gimesia panareensis]